MDEQQNLKPFRVLTLDGGGMRGLYTATLLKRLCALFDDKFKEGKKHPDIGSAFDLICGTSTGAILACSLAKGCPIDDIISLYSENGETIFTKPLPKEGKIKIGRWIYKHRYKPAANVDVLKTKLEECFGEMTLGELYSQRKIALCIPSINAENHRAWVFKTSHSPLKHRDDGYSLVNVCLASASAPIFFPIHNVKNPEEQRHTQYFVDGGLWANNPIMVGFTEALTLAKAEQPIELVSIGTCELPSGDPSKLKINRGIIDWKGGIDISNMSISSQAVGYSYMATALSNSLNKLGKKVSIYRMIESQKSPEAYSAIGLDTADGNAIQTLLGLAGVDAEANHSEVVNNPSYVNNKMIIDIFSNIQELTEENYNG